MSNKLNFDLTSIFLKNKKIFLYFGFWKVDKSCKYEKLYVLYSYLCFAVMILFLLPQFIYMLVNSHNILEVTATMYVFCTFFVNLVKAFGIYFKMDEIKELFRNFEHNPLLQVKCPLHLKKAKQTKKLGDFLFIYGSFLGACTQVFWTLAPILQVQRTLPSKGWYPYDALSSPYFEATSLFQNFASAFNILQTMNVDSFTLNLMMEVGLQCDFLKVTLGDLTIFKTVNGNFVLREERLNELSGEFNEEMKKNLRLCIKHYIEIKRIANTVEDIYRISLLTLFLGGAFILCTIFYQLLVIKVGSADFFYLMFFLSSMLTEQFVICWFGNEMTYKSSRIFNAVYNIPSWIDCDLKFRKMLCIFLLSTQKPIVIYAGHLIPLSTKVFISVLRTSYSYFTLLNNI